MKRSRGQSFFRFAVAVFGVVAGIALLGSVPASASDVPADAVPPPENFSTERTDYFSVSAETSASARAAGTLAREVENYFRKNAHRWRAVLPPQGVRANVELFSRAGVFRIERDSESGDITLYISENPDPRDVERSARILRREFARALLMQALVARNGAELPRVPAWIAAAVAEDARIVGSPSRGIFLVHESFSVPSFSPMKILAGTDEDFDDDAALRLNALWLLRAVPDVSVFLDAEKNDSEKFFAAFPQAFRERGFNAADAEKFWATHFREMLRRAPAGVDAPEDSRRVFDEMLLFSVARDGADARVLASELIAQRTRADIRALVEERLAALAEHFRRVNPVWHNAFAEYGVFLEMFPNPDVPDDTLAAQWEKTVLARGNARTLQREVREVLEKN